MRTTIDLPDELHDRVRALAHDRRTSLSRTVTELVRQALGGGGTPEVGVDDRTGLPVVRLGRVVTSEDVRALDDE